MNYDNSSKEITEVSTILLTKNLPKIFRLLAISHKKIAENLLMHNATIFYDKKYMRVAWVNDEEQTNLKIGKLVTASWGSNLISNAGRILVNNLQLAIHPTGELNLFRTVPTEWVPVPSIIKYGKSTFDDLTNELKLLFNAIFWQGDRFYRYLLIPGSLSHNFTWTHGNIMHSIVMAKKIKSLTEGTSQANLAILTLVALIKNAAKANNYVVSDNGLGFEVSKLMHPLVNVSTLIEWIIVAKAQYQINLNDNQYSLLLDLLSNSCEANSENALTLKFRILKIAEQFSITHARFHNRPKYVVQGIQPLIEKTYFEIND